MTRIAVPVLRDLVTPGKFAADGTTLVARHYRALLAAIHDGRFGADARLPSTRAAAEGLGVSRNTVSAVYDLLRAEGLIEVRAGAAPVVRFDRGSVVRQGAGSGPARLSRRGLNLVDDPRAAARGDTAGVMAPGAPDETLFPADLWARALRRVARRRHGPAFHYGAFHGIEALRRVLAEGLAADRGVHASPDQIIILPGTQSALTLAAQVLTDPGEAAALEDPGYAGARSAFAGSGLLVHALPVDAEGADPAGLDTVANLRLIYLTPSNQYPLGRRLSHRRRLDFLALARACGAWVLEDDYDGEFQWRGQEIAAMQAMSEDARVLYLGTAAKALMPGLRLGWVVVPDALVDPMRQAQRNLGLGANLHAQAALAEMMQSGAYRAHLRRMARVNAERGEALVTALQEKFGDALSVRVPDGGLQVSIGFGGEEREGEAQGRLVAAGFAPSRLSGFGITHRPTGLVVGFADATPDRVRRFVEVLAAALGAPPQGLGRDRVISDDRSGASGG